jgi:outer membrane protein insertion porin family
MRAGPVRPCEALTAALRRLLRRQLEGSALQRGPGPVSVGRKFIRAFGENSFEPFSGLVTQSSGSNESSPEAQMNSRPTNHRNDFRTPTLEKNRPAGLEMLKVHRARLVLWIFFSTWTPQTFGQAQNQAAQAATTVQMQPSPPPEAASLVRFVGNRSFGETDLRNALADPLQQIRSQGLSVPLADDTAFYLGVFYRRHGYPLVDVRYRIYGNGRFLELDIREGPYYKLGNITFRGNRTFPPATLNDFMVGTTRARFSQFQKQLPFVEADLVTGTSLVQGYYISQGFPKVEIVKLETRPDQARGAIDAIVTIIEGPRYFFGPITFTNDPGIPMEIFSDKIRALTQNPTPFSDAQLATLQRDLTFAYKQVGHYNAVVTVTPDFDRLLPGGKVPIRVASTAGPVYRFGDIVVSQSPRARLKPDFLPNRFSELRGRIYSPHALQGINNALIRTGLFSGLDLQEKALPDDTIRLTLSPHEAQPKEFGVFGGYRTFDGVLLGANYVDRNIGGEGHIFSATAEYTGRGPQGLISYEDPWFLNTKNRFRAALGIEGKTVQGYTYTNTYALLSLTRKYGTQFSAGGLETGGFETGGYVEFKNVNLSDVTIDPKDLVGPGSYQLLTVGLTQTIDRRDNPLNPRRGWILALTASASEPTKGASTFLRATERFSYYFPIGKGLFAFGVRFGLIAPSSGGTLGIPIEERFVNGGADTVRSFAERELGPKDNNNNPVGNVARSVFNVEYDYPVFGDLFGAVFLDAGGLGSSPFDDFSTGIGLGARYNLPVGPLRIDYGVNPSPRKNEDFGAFHLSFGVAF